MDKQKRNDKFWDYVNFGVDGAGAFKCKFCDHEFTAGTSVSRVKWHLSGVKRHGVRICERVPEDIQEKAYAAIDGPPQKKSKAVEDSSGNEVTNAVSTPAQEQNNQLIHEETAQVENYMRELEQLLMGDSSHDRLPVNQDEPRGLGTMNDVENIVREPEQPVVRGSSGEGVQRIGDGSRGDAFPTKKLVGGQFEENKNAIWSWLMNDEVSCIGIYGMAGVGKTALVKHIYDQLLERPDNFGCVYWITVSRDFSINRLQNSIARRIDLDVSNEDEELHRAVKLSSELMKKQKWVLILDDLWNSFQPCEVGIPIQVKGCKLILTTRSERVCQQMDSQEKIKVKPLSKEEAWTLFMEKLGRNVELPPKVEEIAQSITKECAGLPLGIITVAGAMKGVDDIREWRNALEELRLSRFTQDDINEKVFKILRFSYTHLKDSTLQQCFLYCALYPEDFGIRKEDLIAYLIDEGVIKRMKSREAEFDRGHSMLNTLVDVCLLECGRWFENEGYAKVHGISEKTVMMHDLIRDMALQIQQEKVMVKAGARLKELPDAEEWEWTENLARVSLMCNQIEEIPSTHSPRLPTLSTLLLCRNLGLRFIADSFFKQLLGLKVLDLSCTSIEILPDSVSDLVSLTALLLERCGKLRHVPSLKGLRMLKRLDLFRTALEKVPQGMKCLANLRYLRLSGCGEKEFPSGILPQLSNLQVLIIDYFSVGVRCAPVAVKGKEVACLRKLETLKCYFEHLSDLTEYVKSRDETQSLSTYEIMVGGFTLTQYKGIRSGFRRKKSVGLVNLSINRDEDFQVVFPKDIEELAISNCNDAITSLCDVHATELKATQIWDCNSMESLVSSSWFCSVPPPSPFYYNGIFTGLKVFQCMGCKTTKKLFPLILLPNLINLEEIIVDNCAEMEEIIANEEGVMGEEFSLPKLRVLELSSLPELKSFCSAKVICDSLEEIAVFGCEKLKRMPISIPLLDNGEPSPPPSLREIDIGSEKWWETVVEWEHPNAKDVLRNLLRVWSAAVVKCTVHIG